SNNTSDILEEARFATLLSRASGAGLASDDQPGVSATQALFAATLGGARALGLSDRIAALKEGMQADIAVVSLDSIGQQPIHDPADALIFSSSGRDVLATVVGGREVYRNGHLTTTAEDYVRMRMDQI